MNLNWLAVIAFGLALLAFQITYYRYSKATAKVRGVCLAVFGILSLPGASFAFYYTGLIPESAWYYEFRAFPFTELLVIPIGITGGFAATFLPRLLLAFPLFVTLAFTATPFLKPLLGPLPEDLLETRWVNDVCLQSTTATCGPASLATVVHQFGIDLKEREIAHRAHTYKGGTEAWYLARVARQQGLNVRFDFYDGYAPEIETPYIAGVRLGAIGHFIPILSVANDTITIADPLRGRETLSTSELLDRYDFTGFHMIIESNRSHDR